MPLDLQLVVVLVVVVVFVVLGTVEAYVVVVALVVLEVLQLRILVMMPPAKLCKVSSHIISLFDFRVIFCNFLLWLSN